ncbi:eCIS core domain-containing protein [Aquimarina sp. 2201CG14-23]|uniref:eCIS core domain-containing protein n=1 Tax=Aquimarina mycalae TaxID=3040073 RepID=UPI0024782CD5|nr:DUF4157 domain-containing protein [Aquimarina sp. 2201CG14-23]MDH7444128.1 DUF4157 domain-containing protein [Aquimarina sp. 2201CG14-23]
MFKGATANTTQAKSSNASLFQKEKGDSAFIQPKLTIGKPGDKYEVEADKVADAVVAKRNDQSNSFFSPTPLVQKQQEEEVQKQETTENLIQQKPVVEHITPFVQKQSEEEPIQEKEEQEVQEKTEGTLQKEVVADDHIQQKIENNISTPDLQKQEEEIQEKEEEEEPAPAIQKVQRKSNGIPNTNSSIESRLHSSKGGGAPLPKETKNQMESGFGTDFSNVRVHTDTNAKQMSQDMGAQAFTHGNDIYFNEGKFDTSSDSGQHLLAHELTHTVQQGGGVKRKAQEVTSAPKMIQGSFLDWIPDWILNNARHIPGYLLFTVIIQYDPLLGQRVEPTPINLLQGLMGLVPFGTAIFDKLQEYGIIQQAFDWVSGRLRELNLTTQGILDLVEEAWDESSLTTFIGTVRDKFNELLSRIELFAASLIDQIITWIKEALIGVAEPILEENRAWSLIKKIIHYDPLRDEEVAATTVEILEDFLMLIGKETELEQMRERGTLQETADWLDTQVGTFMSLLGELRGLIRAAWDAIRPANLTEITANLTALSGRVTGFLERVWAFAATVAIEVLKLIKKALLSWLSSVANETRGFSLVKVIIGKDPFTDERVPRTVPNLIRGFMSLMDGGEEQYAQMVETGAIARITGEIEAAVETLNMTPEYIVQLFTDLWNSFSIDDLLNPIDAFIRIIERFGEPIGRLIAFVAEIVRIVIVAILEIMNFPFELIGNIITRSLQAIEDIKKDPIGFLKNVLRAIKEGFVKFFDNIVTHLINGVMGWLMRELRDAGIPELTDFSLQGVISWVLEVLGLSMEKIWEKLAEHPRIGPERVARIRGAINTLEGIWTFIKDVQERGIAAIWDKIQEQLSNLWNIVIDAVKNFVMTRIITQITTKLLSMLDPTGIMAVINGAIAFFNAVQSFIQYLREMLEVINSFVNGIADIAQGNVATAADYLERTMGQSMPVVIGFLANQVGLGGIGARIAEIIGSVRALIDEALTWLVNKAVDTGMALLDRVMGRTGGEEGETEQTDENFGLELGSVESTFQDEDEEDHRLYITLLGNNATVMMASDNPGDLEVKIQNEKTNDESDTPEQETQLTRADQLRAQLVQFIQSHLTGSEEQNVDAIRDDIQRRLNAIRDAVVAGGIDSDLEIPQTEVTHGMNGNRAGYVRAHPLTNQSGNTTGASPGGLEIQGWSLVRAFDYIFREQEGRWDSQFWIRFHLLHDGMHGPATLWNLIPAHTRDNRNRYLPQIETPILNQINDNKIMFFEVTVAGYYPGVPNIYANHEKFTSLSEDTQRDYHELYGNFPTELTVNAGYLEKNGEGYLEGEKIHDNVTFTFEEALDIARDPNSIKIVINKASGELSGLGISTGNQSYLTQAGRSKTNISDLVDGYFTEDTERSIDSVITYLEQIISALNNNSEAYQDATIQLFETSTSKEADISALQSKIEKLQSINNSYTAAAVSAVKTQKGISASALSRLISADFSDSQDISIDGIDFRLASRSEFALRQGISGNRPQSAPYNYQIIQSIENNT